MTDESTGASSNGSTSGEASSNPYQTPPFLVAAVGASAGGLEAFSRLLRRLPAEAPLALVLVQHLARDQHSMLPDILARRTPLKVTEARDGLHIESGHVYIIPADAHMTVEDGHLRIRPRPAGSSGVQVDLLFRSLAQYYGEKAVGIVLSGGAADGAAGLREIKAVGGITIAQSPEDAQMDGMPRAAIAAGAADLVLGVDDIADELMRLAALPLFQAKQDDDELETGAGTEEIYAAIFRLLRRATGVDFSHYKRPTIARRIARRMTLRHATTLASYLEALQADPVEAQNLQEDLLIHVTSFFREPESFSALKESVFPTLLEERGDAPIRVWVPGCSTGEEVYSLAIGLFESLEEEAELVPIQFFGTDVSKASIERARAGLYSESAVADVSPERLRRFFSRIDGGYQIGKAIRERCVFARQDITRDPPFSRLDLIVCRNTLIYLGQPIQRRIIAMMHYALKPNGFLMLGRAETTGASGDLFSTFDKRAKIYRKKASTAAPEFDFRAAPFEPAGLNSAHELTPRAPARPGRPWDVQAEADRLLLQRHAPPGILVDPSFRIVSARGQTAPFLELPSGEASLDALKMVKQGLLSGLRNALQEARHTRSVVRKEGLRSLTEHDEQPINLEVLPVGGADNPHFFVSFERVVNPKPALDDAARDAQEGTIDESLAQLRRELAATRDQLHANIHDLAATNEELQSANEEILSSNEELQSTNEELDTAKEELQSTNEELSTLNDELHGRNEELSFANSDLANLLASVQIPIVMVARDLTIRRFTPAAQRLLNLIPSDIGRPIGHIKPNIRAVDLEEPIAEVIDTMIAFEQEVEDDAGRAYLLRIRPYKSVENRVDGAVLALFDISTTKEALSVAKRTGDAVISTVSEPILLLDSELRITRANAAFCSSFALTPEEVEQRHLREIGSGAWDIPELRSMLEDVLPERKSFENFSVEHDFPKVGRKKLLLDGRRVEAGKSGSGVILLVIREGVAGAGQ
ncbi:MAG TPA: chemotaxis protein CheB [Polyangiaceae bacterium]|nr:chemotaxis protein CheB [Polyangiaceae bacterium]